MKKRRASKAFRMSSAASSARRGMISVSTSANSSPPSRAAVSPGRQFIGEDLKHAVAGGRP
ncbi:hypothetical protein BAE36_01740 [Rhizobium leguminosarum bv. trifolii]|nr:hypothetical protein BAE36_01740 [Rhizobium leguminosarum bv. trifolii]